MENSETNERPKQPEAPEVREAAGVDQQEVAEEQRPKTALEDLAERLNRPGVLTREQKSGDRVRGAVILAATALGCVFLFFGLFTTESDPTKQQRRTEPNLGRPQTHAAGPEAPNRSVVPQLNVTQQPNEETGELTEKDLLGTMRNRGTGVPTENPPKAPAPPKLTENRQPLSAINFEDPALTEAYRRRGLTPPQPRSEVGDWSATPPPSVPATAAPVASVGGQAESLRKSSLVYVRNAATTSRPVPLPALNPETRTGTRLPQGTKLVARLQSAVNSAAKVPVVAVIEYNYEHDGDLVVPAGTKALGTLAQASPQGWVTIKFDSLEFPGGEREKINGSALALDQGMLRGVVKGRNTGKKFLTRTLTGIGTIAAFAVGGRGLGGQIDNSILLRERLSSNIAMAGEQELAMLAYQQNIIVTVPANTRFYLVLHEPTTVNETLRPRPASETTSVSPQELQELIAIRNEMREMSRAFRMQPSQGPSNGAVEPEK